MDYLIKGILLGLVLSYLPGPIFFGLLQVGIERGFRAAISYASGIWICDVIFVFVTYFGVSYLVALTEIKGFHFYSGLVGGGILAASGLGTLLARSAQIDSSSGVNVEQLSRVGLFLRGFFFNLFNPGTIIFWLGVSGQLSANQPSGQQAILFFGGMWSALATSDIIKAYLAKQIKNRLTPKILFFVKTIISLILIGIGIFMVIQAFRG